MKHNQEPGPPCRHMEALLQELAKENLRGWKRWYAAAHAAQCERCGTFLDRMRLTVAALKAAKAQPSDAEAIERLRGKLNQIDRS